MTRVHTAIEAIRRGSPVLVLDDDDREGEADLIAAGDLLSEATMALIQRHSSGIVCVALTEERARELELAPMVPPEYATDPNGTAFTVSVDAAYGTTTGISAADRTTTVRTLNDPRSEPSSLSRPGHVFPLVARPGGVLARPGHTEAAVDLARLAGCGEVGVLAELMNDDGTVARGAQVEAFARTHDLPIVTVAELVAHRRAEEDDVLVHAQSVIPTGHGRFHAVAFEDTDGTAHFALSLGDLTAPGPVLTRVHSECLTGDVFGSQRCDCGSQLDGALERIAARGRGVLIYVRGHEGRGIGLIDKLRAYALQERGRDTVEANEELGHPADARRYTAAAQALKHLGVRQVELLTNNPRKTSGLRDQGIDVITQVPLPGRTTADNVAYLETKVRRLGHELELAR
jgi:3,4-dihydroxy 2-butanone 4-phosphate synthase / GTP cyclohydrolase II